LNLQVIVQGLRVCRGGTAEVVVQSAEVVQSTMCRFKVMGVVFLL